MYKVIEFMKASIVAITLLQEAEGFRAKPYKDGPGKWTIGYGHLIKPGESFTSITKQQAYDLLLKDIAEHEDEIENIIKVPLTQNQYDALVVFVFNIGEDRFAKSTLVRKLNAGDYDAVPSELRRWNKHRDEKTGEMIVSPGLKNRREKEVLLWEKG